MSSGTGGHPSQATPVPPSNRMTKQPTFATVFADSTRPKRQDAIVFDSVKNMTHDDYLDGLEKLIDLVHVRAISSISGGRVCVYFDSKIIVDELKNKRLQVTDYTLVIKPPMNNNKRVVISNVHPSIPDEIIVEALKNEDIILQSTMNTLRASLVKSGRPHIQSFRRQFYIRGADEQKLPETMQITHEETTFWTYMTTE
ncbi:hypothetical protein QAD02_021601 [Eretmocerus hayati]|uniref:Uncharacterized protein n=1 Tax=Eretmocerus hayati TaxID=131215 RepID=A0ACC2PQQ0_9HYME|nr:hypothetical protein QAD02_021601 [Eretmocerus hayati]